LVEQRNTQQQDRPMCLALLDVDYFKKINNTFDHAVMGGECIGPLRAEELAAIPPNSSFQTAYLIMIMKKTRNPVEARLGTEPGSSITTGVRATEACPKDQRKADKNLYHSKRAVRNQAGTDLDQMEKAARL
jgi:GGDEF domain-containing protein